MNNLYLYMTRLEDPQYYLHYCIQKNRSQGQLELISSGSTQRDEIRLENRRGQVLTWPSWWLHKGTGGRSRSHQMNCNAVSQNFHKRDSVTRRIFFVGLNIVIRTFCICANGFQYLSKVNSCAFSLQQKRSRYQRTSPITEKANSEEGFRNHFQNQLVISKKQKKVVIVQGVKSFWKTLKPSAHTQKVLIKMFRP